jgi:hypothetical protein
VREGTGEEPFKGQTIKCVSSVFVRAEGAKRRELQAVGWSAEAEGFHGWSARAHYTGKLASNGRKFDSSYDRGSPLQFKARLPALSPSHNGTSVVRTTRHLLREVLGAAGAHAPCWEWPGTAWPSTGCRKAAPLTTYEHSSRRF